MWWWWCWLIVSWIWSIQLSCYRSQCQQWCRWPVDCLAFLLWLVSRVTAVFLTSKLPYLSAPDCFKHSSTKSHRTRTEWTGPCPIWRMIQCLACMLSSACRTIARGSFCSQSLRKSGSSSDPRWPCPSRCCPLPQSLSPLLEVTPVYGRLKDLRQLRPWIVLTWNLQSLQRCTAVVWWGRRWQCTQQILLWTTSLLFLWASPRT